MLTTQQFLAVHTPGYFFRMFALAAILLALLTIGAGWGNRPVCYAMILGALLSAGADVLTLHLVYPQFDVLLAEDVAGRPLEELQAAAAALYFWGAWMRVPLLMAAVFGCYLYSARTMTVSRAVS
ncbi:MAG: hypothetical protein H6509_03430 [Bryobacterales bacterium]|nr:hypothetical protein [Bryobacterales bacterium]